MPSHFWLDTHVHLQSSLDLDRLLDSAYLNLSKFCTNKSVDDFYVLFLSSLPQQNLSEMILLGSEDRKWRLQLNGSGIKASHQAQEIYLLLGEQLVSSEGIEVLVLGEPRFLGEHAASAKQILASIQNGLAILPWGFGKWLGKRGKIVNSLLQEYATEMSLFIGDIPARTGLLGGQSQLKAAASSAVPLLRGTDPLPLDNEVERVGTYATRLSTSKNYPDDIAITDRVFDAMSELHTEKGKSEVEVSQFGRRLSLVETFRSQIRLRIGS